MKRWTTRWLSVALVLAVAAGGCATPEGQIGLETAGRGLLNLVLSPVMIAAGLAQGLAFLPYTIGTGLIQLNQALLEAQAVSLDDAYRATYGVGLEDPRVDRNTGEVAGESLGFGRYRPGAIVAANLAFQRLLVSQGMPAERARHHVIGAVYTDVLAHDRILLTVMYRHPGWQPIRVASRQTGIVTAFRPEQRGWYEPARRDVAGRVVDDIIDWAPVPYSLLRQDRVVATLMALAAESVKTGKRSPEYWEAERRWLAGEGEAVMRESLERVRQALPM